MSAPHMNDELLLGHCLNALTGEYGEIANTILVEQLRKRLSYSTRVPEALAELAYERALSPAEYRRLMNGPWRE
jgi:hypothetical protein